MTQSNYVLDSTQWLRQDGPIQLAFLCDKFQKGIVQVPSFQREFVWTKDKVKGWAESVINQLAIGVIVLYQLKDTQDNTLFVCDGVQRLTATTRFMLHPEAYGFKFDSDQASEYCMAFQVPVQYRKYQDHLQALEAFQNLNKGTTLTSAEFFRGILTLDPSGKGKLVVDKVPDIVFGATNGITKESNRDSRSRLTRDAYALFLQYASGDTRKSFWDVGKTKLGSRSRSVEQNLLNFFQGMSHREIEQKMKSFDTFVAGEIAQIKALRDSKVHNRHKKFSHTLIRYLLHLTIWKKNTNRSSALYWQIVERLLDELKSYNTLTSRFSIVYVNKSGETTSRDFSLSVSRISNWIDYLCDIFDIPFLESNKRPPSTADKGYHVSHYRPISMFGEGDTFNEPGPANLLRGDKAVEVGN